jgi:hypothetical protein
MRSAHPQLSPHPEIIHMEKNQGTNPTIFCNCSLRMAKVTLVVRAIDLKLASELIEEIG